MFLDDRLRYSELVNAVANGLNRLGHSLVLERGQILRLHAQSPAIFGARVQVVLLKPIVHDGTQVGTGLRRHSFNDNSVRIVGRVGLGDLGVVDLPRAQFLLEALNGVIRVDVHRVIDLHLQDQVSTALKVQSQVDPLLHGREQSLARPIARHAKDSEQEE